MQVTVAAGQTQTLEISGTPKRSGYYNITANATGSTWHEPAADMLGFNVATDNAGARAAGAYAQSVSGLETLEDHLDNLPKFTAPEEYAKLETAQVLDDVNEQDNVRLDSRLENVQFGKAFDGSTSEPFNTVVQYIPDSGSGQPSAVDLKKPNAEQRSKLQLQGWGCGYGGLATVEAKIAFGGKEFKLRNIRISVWDENPWLSPTPISYGYTDANGIFTFPKPSCDLGAFWDYSQADLFFMVESIDVYQIGVWNIVTPLLYSSTYGARTGTNWDAQGSTFSFTLTGGNSDSENALWLARMVQYAQDYNVDAGGGGGSYFPVRISWPSRLDPRGWGGSTEISSFALVSKLDIIGPDWLHPFIAWHEFGHELMYRTSNDPAYQLAYFRGPHELLYILPQFPFGEHNPINIQNPILAYNEGFANYFYALVSEKSGIVDTKWTWNFTNCGINCGIPAVGEQNELRVSSFLYRYTNEVVKPANEISLQAAYGKIREQIWGFGHYALTFSQMWYFRIKTTLPTTVTPNYAQTTKNIAIETTFATSTTSSLVGLP